MKYKFIISIAGCIFFAVVLLCSITYMGISIAGFFIGFHNEDLGQNMRYLEARYHMNLTDVTMQGNEADAMDLMRIGSRQMITNFARFGLYCFCFGYSFVFLISMINFNKKEMPSPPPYKKKPVLEDKSTIPLSALGDQHE